MKKKEVRQTLISRSREILQNPYAYLEGDGEFDALVPAELLDVHGKRHILQNPYAYLDGDGTYQEFGDEDSRPESCQPLIGVQELLGARKQGESFSRPQVETVVKNLLLKMWDLRSDIFVDREELSPLEALDPSVALNALGYMVESHDSLGHYSDQGESFEVAGILDNSGRRVLISSRFSREIRRFTTAHELGHAVIHAETGLHRDRAIDGAHGHSHRERKVEHRTPTSSYIQIWCMS